MKNFLFIYLKRILAPNAFTRVHVWYMSNHENNMWYIRATAILCKITTVSLFSAIGIKSHTKMLILYNITIWKLCKKSYFCLIIFCHLSFVVVKCRNRNNFSFLLYLWEVLCKSKIKRNLIIDWMNIAIPWQPNMNYTLSAWPFSKH